MTRLIKPLVAAAVAVGLLALAPGAAQADDDDAILLCQYFIPHSGDTLLIAADVDDSSAAYEVYNCFAAHPSGPDHLYFVTRWWNDQLTWTPGWWYCETPSGNPYNCLP